MQLKKHIPNFITILNLVCGVWAILFFLESVFSNFDNSLLPSISKSYSIQKGLYLILLATILDFLDGFLARILNVKSEIGSQLDSLADMVTFGVAPGFLFYAIAVLYFPQAEWLKYLFVLIPTFSAIRLAVFNVDEEQTTYFKGLATPANAMFWVGIAFLLIHYQYRLIQLSYIKYFIAFLVVTLSLLMVSNLRMFSLKLKNLKLEGDNIYRVTLIVGAIILTIIVGLFTNILVAIPFIILLYILLSIGYHFNTKTKN